MQKLGEIFKYEIGRNMNAKLEKIYVKIGRNINTKLE